MMRWKACATAPVLAGGQEDMKTGGHRGMSSTPHIYHANLQQRSVFAPDDLCMRLNNLRQIIAPTSSTSDHHVSTQETRVAPLEEETNVRFTYN